MTDSIGQRAWRIVFKLFPPSPYDLELEPGIYLGFGI